ncbi:hypothetical protein OJ997_06520 [Solirubrobacter phytolaccae]|uniref:ABC-three component systems C-terminal domain-containing protein n=1 Tax=Solirubrobacter phytolaccae TaxID=1404360 RepID=A0A9X3N5R6_9ACTN|nr:ABC-three component system protein [Solirubrobacter phytolaccae]MDA0179941.1 hypothetical protein [Solirubrobacter phytolaccae]
MLQWHYAWFKVAWTTLSEKAFQQFFEDIMVRSDPTFCPVAPAGPQGDRKSDGYQTSNHTNYQVYAPETPLTTAPTCKKIREDFEGAKTQWPSMKRWIFVWSTPRRGLPPDAVKLIATLNSQHAGIEILQWGEEALWQIVRELPEADRNDLLRPYPGSVAATGADVAADVASLLNSVASLGASAASEDLTLTAPREKLDRNDLTAVTERIVQGALGLVPTVRRLADEHPDPEFAPRVAAALKALYIQKRQDIDDSDALFFSLVETVGATSSASDERFWAAAAIVTRAFEICDVFEP